MHLFENPDRVYLCSFETPRKMICGTCHKLIDMDIKEEMDSPCVPKIYDGWFRPYIHLQRFNEGLSNR